MLCKTSGMQIEQDKHSMYDIDSWKKKDEKQIAIFSNKVWLIYYHYDFIILFLIQKCALVQIQ